MNTLNYISCAALVLLSIIVQSQVPKGTAESKSDAADLVMSLCLKDSVIQMDQHVVVTVKLENRGTKLISLPAPMQPEDHWVKFEVENEEGKLIRYTGPEYKLRYTNERVSLLPSYFWGREFDLSDLYKIGRVGSYTIRAIYGVPPTPKDISVGPIYSNRVKLYVKLKK
ncbi:MAG: hypothetical protein L0287_12190 [Anaerolineae bacterium]|nr:hypothetical protein [Anaerolineae bacterium]